MDGREYRRKGRGKRGSVGAISTGAGEEGGGEEITEFFLKKKQCR